MEQNAKTIAEGAPKFALTIVDLDANHMHAALGIPEDRRLVLTESLKETFAKLDEAAKGKEVNSVHFLNELLGEAENFNEATVLTYAFAINFEKRLRRKREGNGLAALLAAITE